jgi:hypothetical protein
MARLAKLPGWVVSNEESVRREAGPYRHLSDEERFERLAQACRGLVEILSFRDDAEQVMAWQDPLPASSLAHLARLRSQFVASR